MKLQDLERATLEILSLKIQLLQKEIERFNTEQRIIVQKFCNKNDLNIEKTTVDIATGEVTVIKEKVEEKIE